MSTPEIGLDDAPPSYFADPGTLVPRHWRDALILMTIRPYKLDDLAAVVAVFRSNIPKYFTPPEETGLHEFLATTRAEDYYIVEVDGKVVGSGGIVYNDIDPPTVSLCWGMIRQDHLGTGLGKLLTEFRIDLAGKKFPLLPLTIGTSQHTEGFYRKYGFRTVEHTTDGFGPGIDNCRMRLDPKCGSSL